MIPSMFSRRSGLSRGVAASIALAILLSACATDLPEPVACKIEDYVIKVDTQRTYDAGYGEIDGSAVISGNQSDAPPRSAFERVLSDAMEKSAAVPPDVIGLPYADPKTLALSGGGPWGAYGAGFLDGWRDRLHEEDPESDIPKFAVVTGISTGALQATYAFLGGEELERLEELYRNAKNDELFKKRNGLVALLSKNALYSAAPLRETLKTEIVDRGLIERVAKEGKESRLLLVGFVDLNSGDLLAADLTKLAGDEDLDDEQRAACYVDFLVASSAVPVAFDPVHTSEGVKQRVLVDGGIRAAVFVDSLMQVATHFSHTQQEEAETVVIVNGMLRICSQDKTEGGILSLAGRSVGILVNQNSVDSLASIVDQRSADNHCVRFTSVEFMPSFCTTNVSTTDFNPALLNELADLGRNKAMSDSPFDGAGDCSP